MGKREKIILAILRGNQDNNIRFDDLCQILCFFGFNERVRGDHHIFTKQNVDEILNIQPLGSLSKPYQVKQVRNIILKYNLGGNSDV